MKRPQIAGYLSNCVAGLVNYKPACLLRKNKSNADSITPVSAFLSGLRLGFSLASQNRPMFPKVLIVNINECSRYLRLGNAI